MTTQYRVIIHCDRQASPQCHGLWESTAPDPSTAYRAPALATQAGWLRGTGATKTEDVCPACRPYVPASREGLEVARP